MRHLSKRWNSYLNFRTNKTLELFGNHLIDPIFKLFFYSCTLIKLKRFESVLSFDGHLVQTAHRTATWTLHNMKKSSADQNKCFFFTS